MTRATLLHGRPIDKKVTQDRPSGAPVPPNPAGGLGDVVRDPSYKVTCKVGVVLVSSTGDRGVDLSPRETVVVIGP